MMDEIIGLHKNFSDRENNRNSYVNAGEQDPRGKDESNVNLDL